MEPAEITRALSGASRRVSGLALRSVARGASTRLRASGLALLFVATGAVASDPEPEPFVAAYLEARRLADAGRYEASAEAGERALALGTEALGAEHLDLVYVMNNLGATYLELARLDRAEALFRQALARREASAATQPKDLAVSLNNLALVIRARGEPNAARGLLERALAIDSRALGPAHPTVAVDLGNLAGVALDLYEFDSADAYLERADDILKKQSDPRARATLLHGQARSLYRAGRYGAAELRASHALEILRDAGLGGHPSTGATHVLMAQIARAHGQLETAEMHARAALTAHLPALGPQHPTVAADLSELAHVLRAAGRLALAEPIYQRALDTAQIGLGPDHPAVAAHRTNLAEILLERGDCAAAEDLLRRAIADFREAAPPDPRRSAALANLGVCRSRAGAHAEAVDVFEHALAIEERELGPEHPALAGHLVNIGLERLRQGDVERARTAIARANRITEKAVAGPHPSRALAKAALARVALSEGRTTEALQTAERAVSILRERYRYASSGLGLGERRRARDVFETYQAVLARARSGPDASAAQVETAFEIGQVAQTTRAGIALDALARRLAPGPGESGRRLRAYQRAHDALERAAAEHDAALARAARGRTVDSGPLLERWQNARRHAADAFAALRGRRPELAQMLSRESLPLREAMDLLDADEALIYFWVGRAETYVWVVRDAKVTLHRAPIGRTDLRALAARVLRSLEQPKARYRRQIRDFDFAASHALYRALVEPTADALVGARTLFVAPDGPLRGLPMGVLVREIPEASADRFARHRDADWLARSFATVTLPEVRSLKLAMLSPRPRGAGSFVGFGDPAGVALGALPRLPESEAELSSLAQVLGGDDDRLFLGEQATESRLRELDLGGVGTLAFSTHGVRAGELPGVLEPALLLAPTTDRHAVTPATDGVLRASEIATLELGTEWVFLSACNTAASDGTPDSVHLSGLAQAFFAAGARSLLVSYFSVNSRAALALTRALAQEITRDSTQTRAAALRRARERVIDSPTTPHFAHPMFWAPFELVSAHP